MWLAAEASWHNYMSELQIVPILMMLQSSRRLFFNILFTFHNKLGGRVKARGRREGTQGIWGVSWLDAWEAWPRGFKMGQEANSWGWLVQCIIFHWLLCRCLVPWPELSEGHFRDGNLLLTFLGSPVQDPWCGQFKSRHSFLPSIQNVSLMAVQQTKSNCSVLRCIDADNISRNIQSCPTESDNWFIISPATLNGSGSPSSVLLPESPFNLTCWKLNLKLFGR